MTFPRDPDSLDYHCNPVVEWLNANDAERTRLFGPTMVSPPFQLLAETCEPTDPKQALSYKPPFEEFLKERYGDEPTAGQEQLAIDHYRRLYC
jgi:hypothetical protein